MARIKACKQAALDYLTKKPFLSTQDASRLLQISEATVRRLFAQLEREGDVVRVYGGVRVAEKDSYYSYTKVSRHMMEEKRRIGIYAAGIVASGDSIYLDCGTTTEQMSEALAARFRAGDLENVSIVTNSLPNIHMLSGLAQVVMVGGEYFIERRSFAGSFAESYLSQFHFDKCFAGLDGMRIDTGIMTSNTDYSRLTAIAIDLSDCSYALMDSSKVDRPAFALSNRWESIGTVIVDDGILPEQKQQLSAKGVRVITV